MSEGDLSELCWAYRVFLLPSLQSGLPASRKAGKDHLGDARVGILLLLRK